MLGITSAASGVRAMKVEVESLTVSLTVSMSVSMSLSLSMPKLLLLLSNRTAVSVVAPSIVDYSHIQLGALVI